MSAEESLQRAEELLKRLEETRAKLEATEDPQEAVDVLAELAETGTPATFFVEGVNAETYPEALHSIVAAGHECGYHAWRHEDWSRLNEAEERIAGRRLRRDCFSAETATLDSRSRREDPSAWRPARSQATKSIASAPSGTAWATTVSAGPAPGRPTKSVIGTESSP